MSDSISQRKFDLEPPYNVTCPHCRGARHFPDTTMICCLSKNKRDYMKPGDVLVDDWTRYRPLWEEAGGIFIHHKSAKESIEALRKYFEL